MRSSVKRVVALSLIILFLATIGLHQIPSVAGQSSIRLQRSPQDVYSMQPVIVYAYYNGSFNSIKLRVTADIDASVNRSGIITVPNPSPRTAELTMVPAGWGAHWYVAGIPGLPSKTISTSVNIGVPPFTTASVAISITSKVTYTLLIDGVEKAAGSYTVLDGEVERRIPPLALATVYDVVKDPSIIEETLGFGPKGWAWSSESDMKVLIVAVDDKGLSEVTFEYSVSGGSWVQTSISDDKAMESVRDFVNVLGGDLKGVKDAIQKVKPDFDLPLPSPPLIIGNAVIPAQSAGSYVEFRANATDIDGNAASSPMGLYYVVNKATTAQRVLIVDPHVWLWLYEENMFQFADTMKRHFDYQVPDDLTSKIKPALKIAQDIREYGVEPFHHWEYLGEAYDLYIAYPKSTLTDQLNSRWDAIVLSNLWLGYLRGEQKEPWDWDLKDLGVFDKLVEYVKANHTGLIATHGTLSDWVVWRGCEEDEHQKVGSRGHVGNTIGDLNILKENTVAALLGMPHLSLWELARDKLAYSLCKAGEEAPLLKAAGLAVGSLPLQVPYVPFNETMRVTNESKYVGWNIPQEFTITTPSVYKEAGIQSYTQIGWQLAMPSGPAYAAWWKAKESRPLAHRLYERLSHLIENVTDRFASSSSIRENIEDSLEWGLNNFYTALISSNITGTRFETTVSVPDLNKTIELAFDIGKEAYDQLLQLLPVKLIAVSKDGLSGIITHDKYWHKDGYRSVYFSFEPEASEGAIAKTLLIEAIQWSIKWEYKDITTLLGDKLRLTKDKAAKFNEELEKQTGKEIFSDGLILNEKGGSSMELYASEPSRLSILVAHPTSDKISANITAPAELVYKKILEGITLLTFRTTKTGNVTLKLWADPDSSINPSYVSIKAQAEVAPKPAEFKVSNLRISPIEVSVGEPVAISLTVTNIGGESGEYTITLKINGTVEAKRTVTLSGEESTVVEFTVSKDVAGTYVVEVNGLTGSFRVKAAPPTQKPAEFIISDMAISPSEVIAGQTVSITARITNVGDLEGTYTVTLKISGIVEASKNITLTGGESETIAFTVTRDAPGNYTVNLNGLTGSFTVKAPPTVKTTSKISCEVSKSAVIIGEEITVSGSTDPKHPHVAVTLAFTKPDGSTIIRETATDSAGNYMFSYAPDMVGHWRVWASWAGDADHEGAVSPQVEFKVEEKVEEKHPARFVLESLSVSPSKVAVGESVTVSVRVSNVGGEEGSYSLTLRLNDAVEAVKEITLAAKQTQTVSFTITRNVAGAYEVKVDGLTGSFEVTKIPSSISLQVSPSTFSLGGSTTIEGSLYPPQEASITIEFKAAGEAAWSTLANVRTEADGSYSHSWTPDKAGRYEVRASWQGDANHEAAVSPIQTLTVEEKKCIIATAAYGSELNPHVQFLRGFRENVVLKTFAGSQFMNVFNAWYYSFSPSVAAYISSQDSLKAVVRGILYPLLGILHLGVIVDNTLTFNGEVGIVATGILVSALIGFIYFTPLTLIPLYAAKKWRKNALKLSRLKILLPLWITSLMTILLGEAILSPTLMMIGTGLLVLLTVTLASMAAGILALKAAYKISHRE